MEILPQKQLSAPRIMRFVQMVYLYTFFFLFFFFFSFYICMSLSISCLYFDNLFALLYIYVLSYSSHGYISSKYLALTRELLSYYFVYL